MTKIFGVDLNTTYRNMESKPNQMIHDNGSIEEMTKYSRQDFAKITWSTSLGAVNTFTEAETILARYQWDRPPSPAESFSIIMSYLEGKIKSEIHSNIARTLLDETGEFFCYAIRIQGDNLNIYEKVSGLWWYDSMKRYNIPTGDAWFSSNRIFSIKGLETGQHNKIEHIELINPDLVRYLYSKGHENFPEVIKKSKPTLLLPEDNKTWPLCRGPKDMPFSIIFRNDYYIKDTHSVRGVREE